jgi:hypothetical protein
MRPLGVRAVGVGLLASLSLLSAPAVADDLMAGVRVGYYTEVSKPFVGGELLVRVAPRFYFNPNVEAVFVDNGSYLTFNGDFHIDFPTRAAFVWLGGGIAVIQVNPEGPNNTDTSTAANFLAGVGFRGGAVVPYFQAKVIAKSDTEFAVAFGLRF